jgi:hypothetical protein
MTKKTGTIITIVVAVLTLCCSATFCGSGIWTMVSLAQEMDVPGGIGGIGICLGVLVWVVPVLLWVFLVRGKEDAPEVPESV